MKNKNKIKNLIDISAYITNSMERAFNNIDASCAGERRLRPEQWEGLTSLRDVVRIVGFLDTSINTKKLSIPTYDKLRAEISTFDRVVGREVTKYIKAAISYA